MVLLLYRSAAGAALVVILTGEARTRGGAPGNHAPGGLCATAPISGAARFDLRRHDCLLSSLFPPRARALRSMRSKEGRSESVRSERAREPPRLKTACRRQSSSSHRPGLTRFCSLSLSRLTALRRRGSLPCSFSFEAGCCCCSSLTSRSSRPRLLDTQSDFLCNSALAMEL